MKLVQTFWSAEANPTKHHFGWRTPMHHIMSWALSCLKLKEQYDDLHLYTDQQGYEILINYLQLPYKSVHVCFNNFLTPGGHHWALAKMYTYAAQEGAFIHVDGDVFIWKKFDEALENAHLIAQNFEVGTDYYKSMLGTIKKHLRFVPDCLAKEWENGSVFSYNAGVLGGNDPDFFKHFYATAIKLVQGFEQSFPMDINFVFEQLLFYALAKERNIPVTCYFKQTFTDKGYTKEHMMDFTAVPCRMQYLHLIGEYKRDEETCDLLGRTLLKEYPRYFFKIVTLFNGQHNYFQDRIRPVIENLYDDKTVIAESDRVAAPEPDSPFSDQHKQTVTETINRYKRTIFDYNAEWSTISWQLMYEYEMKGYQYFSFFCANREVQMNTVFTRHPAMRLVEDSFNWTQDIKNVLFPVLSIEPSEEIYGIACVPGMFYSGYREVGIDDLEFEMLTILKDGMSLHALIEKLHPLFYEEDIRQNFDIIYDLLLLKLQHLLHHRCIFVLTDK
ncbi:MAG TPA: DUF6734 family protein [Niastella sp.]